MKLARIAPLLAIMTVTVVGCGNDKPGEAGTSGAAAALPADQAFVERMSQATLAWTIAPDGKTQLAVHSPTCQVLKNISGTVEFHRTSDGKKEEVPLRVDSKTGMLTGDGPDLDPELTEIRYDLKVADEPLTGSLHVPQDGTKGLVEAAAEQSKAAQGAAGAPAEGPHGGEVQTVGDDKLEVVADTDTGVVRVYPLTGDLKPSTEARGKLKLAVGGPTPRVVVLRRVTEPDVHWAGLLDLGASSRKLTIFVQRPKAKARVAVLGLRRGHALYVGLDAPRRRFWLRKGWKDQAQELRSGPGAPAGAPDGDEPDGESGGKVTICHVPPGNPANQHTITVGASAVDAHLKHGDYRGPCKPGAASGNKGKSKGKGKGKGKKK